MILETLNFHDQINQFLVIIPFFSLSVHLSHYNSSSHYLYHSHTTLLWAKRVSIVLTMEPYTSSFRCPEYSRLLIHWLSHSNIGLNVIFIIHSVMELWTLIFSVFYYQLLALFFLLLKSFHTRSPFKVISHLSFLCPCEMFLFYSLSTLLVFWHKKIFQAHCVLSLKSAFSSRSFDPF